MTRVLAALLLGSLVLVSCGPAAGKAGSASAFEASEPEPEPEPVDEPDDDDEEDEEEPEDTRPRSHLTGERIDEELLEQPQLLAKIENSPQARPQSGLDAADVVYEERVEGGVTRFIAIFHSEVPEVAGPIRSARPVTTQIMRGYGPSAFAYSGARDEVQAMLAQTPSIRITEGGPGFYRDSSRSAPHNLYVDVRRTLEGAIDRGAEPFTDVGWAFDEDVPDDALSCPDDLEGCTDPGRSIDIRMSREYISNWEYDQEAERYRRSQNGQPFRVTGEGRIGAANLVVLDTRHYVGATGYPETDVVTESAEALVLRDGRRYEATWSKPTADDPLRVLTPDGEPFPLKPGPTWVHLADQVPGIEQ
ncbi:MAG: DUF3048 domain-containing protein [Nitriliruptoraceae bacterium]